MNESRIVSNVYYLPVAAAPVATAVPEPPAPPRWRGCRATLWRLRFAFAEIRAAFRQPAPPVRFQERPLLPPVARTQGPPARVLDFAAFAARTRPAREG